MSASNAVAAAVNTLSARFTGQLLQPGGAEYEQARRVHNGLIDKRPSLIACCRSTADVVDAVLLARECGLEVAVRGGGHNVAGRATIDGGLMIDLAPMKGTHVDPVSRRARGQGGVTWGEFNRDTQLHALAVTGGVISTTGIAGLTLGGGVGWLMGKHGFSVDNLESAQIVTADGRVLTASATENDDLFWAVRGGGGNFGIATSLEYALHPIGPMVTGGLVAHPYATARDVLRFYRDTTLAAPDELTMFAGLIHAPDASAKLAGILACHCGSPAAGETALRPVKSFGSPAMDAMGPIPYSQLNSMLDAGYPKGALNYWKSQFMTSLTDDAIDTMVDCYARCPSPMTQLLLEHVHGAPTRVALSATAFSLRTAGYNMLLLCQWIAPAEGDACMRWARETFEALRPFMAPARYVNYLGNDEGDDPAAAAYGDNYQRLQSIKAKYDPDNFFHMNQNIRPRA